MLDENGHPITVETYGHSRTVCKQVTVWEYAPMVYYREIGNEEFEKLNNKEDFQR